MFKKHLFIISSVLVLFSFTSTFASVMESGNQTLFILLNTISSSTNTQTEGSCWDPNLKAYLEINIIANKGLVYCAEYNSAINSPADFAKEFATNENAILIKALQNWYNNTDDAKIIDLKSKGKNLEKIKIERPDLLPLKYVVIANGASGLAVREYIQGKDYQGEISNVLFFNTPHEGTGFADQALFAVNNLKYIEKKKNTSSLSALIPLTLTAYIAGGIDQLRDVMISLAKDAVIGLATDFASDAANSLKSNYFSNVSPDSKSLWYLAQDADEDDALYEKIIDQSVNVKKAASEALGGIQLLNSFSKNNVFEHPLYNIAYSDGFPTIGNGRRTLSDYYDADKNHISKERLKRILADSLGATLERNGLSLDKDEIKNKIQDLAGELIDGEINENVKRLANELMSSAGNLVENYDEIKDKINSVLKDEKLTALVGGLSELHSMSWNKDDIPGNIIKVISFINKFIPEEYKSQIFSSFMDKISPEIKDLAGKYGKCLLNENALKNCAKLGMKTAAQNLANYSINFFDAGTFDVPSYSAIGENVAVFKKSTTQRFGYQLDEIVNEYKDNAEFSDLRNYQKKLNDLGQFEQARIVVDFALDAGCEALENTIAAYGKICRAAEFAVNIGMMAESAIKIKNIATNAKDLKKTKDIALWAAQNKKKKLTLHNKNGEYEAFHSDLDEMIYSAPKISIAAVLQKNEGFGDSIIPLMLNENCKQKEMDVYDERTLLQHCETDDIKKVYSKAIGVNKILNVHSESETNSKLLSVKYVNYETDKSGNLHARTYYVPYEFFVTRTFINEFRFQIDDVSPDSLRTIKIDFNDKVSLNYERSIDGTWNLYYNNVEKPIQVSKTSPVDKYGNFILSLDKVLKMYSSTTVPAEAEEDGLNVVNLYVENNLGKSDSRQFSFYFQATDPLIEEGWPTSNAIVSRMGEVFISYGDLNYHHLVTGGSLKIYKIEENKKLIFTTSLIPTYDNETRITKLSANLDDFSNNLLPKGEKGEYQLDWKINYLDSNSIVTSQNGVNEYEAKEAKYGYIIYVDQNAPKLKWVVNNQILKGSKSEGAWAAIESLDSAEDLSIRAIRAFVVCGVNNRDTVKLYNDVRTANRYYYVSWPDYITGISGKAMLHVQAYDFSNPSVEMQNALLNITKENTDSLWSLVLDNQGKFVKGINGIDDSVVIWIDQKAPQIVENSVKLAIVTDLTSDGIDLKKNNTEKYLLNAKDTLNISFDVEEEFLLDIDSAEVFTSLIFKNLLNNVERVFYHDTVIYTPTFKYTFNEPEANRLIDGVYSLIVQLKDASDNVRSEKVVDRIVVDRTAPVVAQIYTGGLTFVSPDDLGRVVGYVEQTRDINENKSELKCYSKVNSAGIGTGWVFVGTETNSKSSIEEESISYALAEVIGDNSLPNGNWFVHMRCYDAAGNAGENVDFFGMGARYPQITSPGDTLNSMYYGKVIVKGVAPNPVVVNGDDNLAEFKIEYKKHEEDDSQWKNDSITYLVNGVHVEERALAVWGLPQDAYGLFDLKLSVRGCNIDSLCKWESTTTLIPVYNRLIDTISSQPEINIVRIPENQNPGKMDTISFELKGVPDTAKWTAKVSINVQSPLDESKMVSAADLQINPIRISPFEGEPTTKLDGLSVWKNGTVWNIRWTGTANGISNELGTLNPTLRVKYLNNNTQILSTSSESDKIDDVLKVNTIDVNGLIIPSYDKVMTWNLNDRDLLIQIQSDSAFTIDLSTVEKSDSLIFCGASNRPAREISSASVGNGVLYVHPDQYVVKIPFNGLTATKLYPGGEKVEMDIYAYNNGNFNHAVTLHKEWILSLEASALQTTMPKSGEFFISIGESDDELGSALAKQTLGYTFGLTGRAAMVEAWVENPSGTRIRTLREKSKTIAGSDYQAYSLSWDGMTDDNFVAAQPGTYKIKVCAYDSDDNVIDSLSYDFELKLANTLVEAPYADDGKVYAELSMDEAIPDNIGLRFVGNPDYLLRVNADMQTLPTKEQQFTYKWEWDPNNPGSQKPFMYKTFRPSLGVWRQRDEIPVTVAVLLMSYGESVKHDGKWYGPVYAPYCSITDRFFSYKIKIQKTVLKKYNNNYNFDISLDPSTHLVAFDENGDREYPIGIAVKILPVFEYYSIKDEYLGGVEEFKNVANHEASTALDYSNIWKASSYKDGSKLSYWFNNFLGKKVYWEAQNTQLKHNDKNAKVTPDDTLIHFVNKCVPQIREKDDGYMEAHLSVCDDRDGNLLDLSTYNPNGNMLTVSVSAIENTGFATGDEGFNAPCNDHDGSRNNVKMNVKIVVNEDYWNPSNNKWGYNNLANRYVRFDPTNTTLFSNGGYMSVAASDNMYDGTIIKNELNGEKQPGTKRCLENCSITAFESLLLPMDSNGSNPLLFADELISKNAPNPVTYRKSRYRMNFFNRNDEYDTKYIAMAISTKSSDVVHTIESDEKNYSVSNPKLLNSNYDVEPLDIRFWVAPEMGLNEASYQNESVDYPYTKSYNDFASYLKNIERCKTEYRCYSGMASRIHYGIDDWSESDWNARYLTHYKDKDKLVNNFVLSFLSKKDLNDVNYNAPALNAMNDIRTYKVRSDSDFSVAANEWVVYQKSLDTIKKAESSEYGMEPIRGNFKPKIISQNNSNAIWKVMSDPQKKGQWIIHSAGEKYEPKLNYIFSKDVTQNIQRDNIEHKVSFDAILAQNKSDTILTSAWTQNLKLSNPKVFRRDTVVRKENIVEDNDLEPHRYLDLKDRYKSILKEGYFEIEKKTDATFNTRVDEIATLRGRIPGENVDWKLFYSKNGMIFPAATGTQETVPTEKPYNVLDYINLNKLQGNTSFFLTYGGKNSATYFRQLDVHVGTLVTPSDGMDVHSMYGNISIKFPPHSWGEKNVDVTVRTIGIEDYNLTAFEGIDAIGPVVEVLPSHVFPEDESLRPEIHIVVMKSEIHNLDASNLRIFKPDIEKRMLIPLTTSTHKFKGDTECGVDNCNDQWDRVLLKAKAPSFSKFMVMDSVKASYVVLKDSLPTEKDKLVCKEMSTKPLWAGTANGWLEIPYPCSGKSNYTIQLRSGSKVSAEHQGKTEDPVIWKIRNADISIKDSVYGTRLYFFGSDGKQVEVRSPAVMVDSLIPAFVNDIDFTVTENGTSKNIQVDASVNDLGSGIAMTRFDLYFGGKMIQSRTVLADSVMSEIFAITRPELYNCLGCRATIVVTTEDYGHNFAKATLSTDPLYPYPTSLVLWYPLAEGSGIKGYEATGSGLDLDLSTISKPWWTSHRLHLYSDEYATTISSMVQGDSAMPFSIEMKVSAGYKLGSIFTWTSPKPWTIGISSDRHYYLETEKGRTIFSTKAALIAQEHIVFTIDDDCVQLFKNGELKETKTVKNKLVWVGGGKPVVGKYSNTAMTGYVSDIRLYTTVLTVGQISSLYMDNLDLDDGDIYVARATTLDHSGLVVDQSCAVAGKSYLRQQFPTSSAGLITWHIDAKADNYNAYLLMINNASEKASVEIFVNGVSKGIREMQSTGVWESQKISNLSISLAPGDNTVSIRPIGNVGVAGLALVSMIKPIEADQIDYGESSWKVPTPQVAVKMTYDNSGDVTWVRPKIQLTNLTSNSIAGAKIRYYYKGEGENVQAISFYPSSPMRIAPDDGSVYYGELTLTETIPPYGSAYYGDGPQIGLHRMNYYFPWNILDDPSYTAGAENGYVDGTGIAVLGGDGTLLNDWACFDSDGPATNSRKSAIAYAKDVKYGSNQSSSITMFAQNNGTVAIDGFEIRYYYRNGNVENKVDVYSNNFAKMSVGQAGGNLNYVSFIYDDVVLNPGEKSDFGNGVQFELHLPNWENNFNAMDDPSNYGLNEFMFTEADSILVLDLNGNLLWGSVAQPKFSSEYKYKDVNEDLIHVEGNIIYVDVPEKAYYTFETVNAVGMPLEQIFNETLSEGVHSISIENKTFTPGCYLVLRKGTEILSWQLFK